MESPNTHEIKEIPLKKGLLALSPIAVFLLFYLVVSLVIGDFYKMPLSIAFIIAAIWSISLTRDIKLSKRIEIFSKGASNENVLYMVWIFILAGAFSALAEGIGSIDATVQLTLSILPPQFIIPGVFISACFISVSIGTSVGTIVALAPLSVQLAHSTGLDAAFVTSAVIGGAFFGDNLSFISDTTIAATRSQGCAMNDKFKANLWIAIPAAVIALLAYMLFSPSTEIVSLPEKSSNALLVVPYLIVIISALIGMNVLLVLTLGIFFSVVIALFTTQMPLIDMCTEMGEGIGSMGDLIIITLLAAGLLQIIHYNKGIDFIIQCLTKRIHGKRGAYASIGALVSLVNVCTANNTIAIITTGEISHQVSTKFSLNPTKVASLLDTCSCITQSIIPYGAQILIAAGIAKITPVAFMPYAYYPVALGLMVIISIIFRFPKAK